MADILVRGVPESVIAALDSRSATLGLSRSEYIRRRWAQEAGRSEGLVAVSDLARFSTAFGDLADPDVMGGAWS